MLQRARVLLAEDDADFRALLARALARDGIEVLEVADGLSLKQCLDDRLLLDSPKPRIHALITDVRMPGMDGLRLLGYLRELGWDLPVIIVTAFGSEATRSQALSLGARAVFDKPFSIEAFRHEVHRALEQDVVTRAVRPQPQSE